MIKNLSRSFLIILFVIGSIFPVPHTLISAALKFDTNRYHNYQEMTDILKEFESKHSNLARLISAGKSFQGKELWIMEISNRKAGNPDDKPAIFISGGLNGDEPVGTEVCLFTIQNLLENYGKDNRISELIDDKTFYIFPAINPDACDFSVKNPGKSMIKNFRPTDEDRDGRMDEDTGEDSNGDGFITFMRVKDANGDYQISANDPRIMLPVNKSKGEKGSYQLYTEGIDNDNDQKYNEDGIGGVSLNLNFPSGWKMEYEQSGSGMYPGSEPESEAVMRFLIDHPNVAGIIGYQSGDGALYRPYDSFPDKEIPKLDVKIYELLGEKYKKLTGYKIMHGFPEEEKKEKGKSGPDDEAKLLDEVKSELSGGLKVEDILKMGDLKELVKTPQSQMYLRQNNISEATVKKLIRLQELRSKGESKTPGDAAGKSGPIIFGTFLDWVYRDYSVYALSPSLWTLPAEYQKTSDSTKAEIRNGLSWFSFLEKELDGRGFIPWKKFNHPQLGEVEIGGWSSFYKKNPPVGKRLEAICQDNALFALDLAELTPQIKINQIEIKPIQILKDVTNAIANVGEDGSIKISQGDKKIAGKALLAEVKIKVENVGPLGTRTALGKRTQYSQQPPRSVLAYLEAKEGNLEILSLPKVLRLGVIEGTETKNLVKEEKGSPVEKPQGAESMMMREERDEPESKAGTEPEEPNLKSGTWLVKIDGGSAELMVKVISEKGGTAIKKVSLKF